VIDVSKARLSFIVPALNEEKNIEPTVKEILAAAHGHLSEFEIVMVDDGSTDATGRIMDEMAARIPQVRVIHNERNVGFGGAYKRGVAAASLDYMMLVPGDNAFPAESLAAILSVVGQADMVIPYRTNPEGRGLGRRFLSWAYTMLLNVMFWRRIRYYNGLVVYRTALLQKITIKTDSFAFQAEAVVKLLRLGHNYVEVGCVISEARHGRSKALQLKNVVNVIKTLVRLFFEAHRPLPNVKDEKEIAANQ